MMHRKFQSSLLRLSAAFILTGLLSSCVFVTNGDRLPIRFEIPNGAFFEGVFQPKRRWIVYWTGGQLSFPGVLRANSDFAKELAGVRFTVGMLSDAFQPDPNRTGIMLDQPFELRLTPKPNLQGNRFFVTVIATSEDRRYSINEDVEINRY
jgi:hypothetical protein